MKKVFFSTIVTLLFALACFLVVGLAHGQAPPSKVTAFLSSPWVVESTGDSLALGQGVRYIDPGAPGDTLWTFRFYSDSTTALGARVSDTLWVYDQVEGLYYVPPTLDQVGLEVWLDWTTWRLRMEDSLQPFFVIRGYLFP